MNHPHILKNQTRKSLFQRLTGNLCLISLIRDSDSYAKLKNTQSIHLHPEKTLPSTSNQSHQNALTHGLSKTLLD